MRTRLSLHLGLALLLTASALANPFRDLYLGSDEPEELTPEPSPIIIDTPLEQLPAPPLDIDVIPNMPDASSDTPVSPRVTIPSDNPTFTLGFNPSIAATPNDDTDASITIRRNDPRPSITPITLIAPQAVPTAEADTLTEIGESNGDDTEADEVSDATAPELDNIQVLAVAAGQKPSVLVLHSGERVLLSIGQELPGTPFHLEQITNDAIAFQYLEHNIFVPLRRDAP